MRIQNKIMELFKHKIQLKITGFEYGEIKLNGKVYNKELMLFKNDFKMWTREKHHRTTVKSIRWLIDKRPEEIVIGTGTREMMKVDSQVFELDIPVKTLPSKEAARYFNEHPEVGLAIHITC